MNDQTRPRLTESEIDRIVVAQANDDSAWEEPVAVQRAAPARITVPADLAARAAFLARLHHTDSVEEWLNRIIQERVDLEEAAFIGLKRELAGRLF